MKIIKIVFKNNLYEIYFNTQTIISICESTFVRFNLYKGKELSEEEIISIKENNERQNCLDYILNRSFNRKTEKEISLLLQQQGFGNESINFAISYLIDYNYINDKEYALLYVRDKMKINRYGPLKIIHALRQKGIKDDYIQTALDREYSKEKVKENIKHIIRKKYSDEFISQEKNRNKIYRFLSQRGYSNRDIFDTLSKEL